MIQCERKIFFRILLIFFFCSSGNSFSQSPSYCSSNRFTDVAVFDSSEVRMDTDLVYAVAKNYFTGANDTLRMNIFYPDTNADTMQARPFILLIHGGSFIAGSRHDMDYQCMAFARRGFVTATISYRLGWNCSGTDFLSICLLCGNLSSNIKTATYQAAQDGRAAMRYIDAIHNNYKIDSSNYFIGGTSAGSITAMHTVFWDQQEADEFCPWATGQVGLLDTSGNNLPAAYHFKGVIDNCGGVSKDSIVLNNGDIPMVSFHDEGDCIVPNQYGQVISCACQSFYWVAGSSIIHGELMANNICTSMNLVPLSINHCSFPEYELVNRASCFIRSVLCDSCQSGFNNTPYVLQKCSSVSEIDEGNSISALKIFPNPANNEIHISGLDSKTKYAFELFEISGRKILAKTLKNSSEDIFSLTAIQDGIYIAKITVNDKSHFEKVVIAR